MTCVGDNKDFSFLPSRSGDGILDKIIQNVLQRKKIKYKKFNWLKRGSDERQYCWPNTNISMSSLMRSKYHEYPEYHTSLDDLKKVVTPSGFEGSFALYTDVITSLEKKNFPLSTTFCEPMLSKLNLYPKIGYYGSKNKLKLKSKIILNILSFCDGKNTIEEISSRCEIDFKLCKKTLQFLEKKKLVKMF